VWFQDYRAIGYASVYTYPSLSTRIIAAGRAVWFYLIKALAPHSLTILYPMWNTDPSSPTLWMPWIAIVAALCVLWKYRERWGWPVLLAFAYFCLLLLPVLGLFPMSYQRLSLVADRWQYFALPAVVVVVAMVLKRLKFGYVIAVAVAIIFGSLTFAQCRLYQNSERLCLDALSKNPKSWVALNGLAISRQSAGQMDEAITYYRRSLQAHAEQPEAHTNLGAALMSLGKLEEAIEHFRTAIEINPHYTTAHHDLGYALQLTGRADDAIAEYRKAAQCDPSYLPARDALGRLLWLVGQRNEGIAQLRQALVMAPDFLNGLVDLGGILTEQGNLDEALRLLQKAVAMNPNSAEAHLNLGNTLFALKQTEAAQVQFQTALQLNASYQASYGLANCLLRSGHADEAAKFYEQALAQNPQHAESHFQLAMVLSENKQKQAAIAHFREAARLKPDWIQPVNNLAWFLATDPKSNAADCAQSVRLAEHAVQLSAGRNPVALDTLGVAWARNEVFAKAIEAAHKAAQLAASMNRTNLSSEIQARIDLYNQKKPYIEP
jgi:tetratricopeptide (TPR) repeat protein